MVCNIGQNIRNIIAEELVARARGALPAQYGLTGRSELQGANPLPAYGTVTREEKWVDALQFNALGSGLDSDRHRLFCIVPVEICPNFELGTGFVERYPWRLGSLPPVLPDAVVHSPFEQSITRIGFRRSISGRVLGHEPDLICVTREK